MFPWGTERPVAWNRLIQKQPLEVLCKKGVLSMLIKFSKHFVLRVLVLLRYISQNFMQPPLFFWIKISFQFSMVHLQPYPLNVFKRARNVLQNVKPVSWMILCTNMFCRKTMSRHLNNSLHKTIGNSNIVIYY